MLVFGKTTTLEYIEYQDAINFKKNRKIPVVISLITVDKDEAVETLIARKLIGKDETIEASEEVIDYLIQKNKINLYLDGINEISIIDYHEKKEFLNRLETFVSDEKNKNLKIIVTDRDNSEVSILNNTDTFLVQTMSDEDIDAFIEGNSKPEYIEISQNQEFSEIPMHPIMLKNLITIIECDEEIPEYIEELSEVYLNSIIKREIEEKKDKNAKYINDVLTYMVKQGVMSKNGEDIDWVSNAPTSYFKVIDIFNNYAEEKSVNFDAEELLNLIRKMGILKEVEFQKYAFTDEKFFHIYYYKAISE